MKTLPLYPAAVLSRRFWGLVLLSVTALWAWPASADAPPYSGSAGIGYDSNPGNAEVGSTVPATGYGTAGVASELMQHLSGDTALLTRGSLDAQQYFRYAGLSNARATLQLSGLYRAGGGFFAPTVAVWSSALGMASRSHIRSGGEYRGGVYVDEQLSTAINLRLGGYASERDADSEVFTLRDKAATLDAGWLLGDRLTAHLGYEYRYGGFAVSSPADPGALAFSTAHRHDDTLSIDGVGNIVYRLKGHAQIGTFGLNYALTPTLALDAQAQKIHSVAVSHDHYDRWLTELCLFVRF